jgi:hypothetical protein
MRSDSIVGWYLAVTLTHSTVFTLITEKADATTLHMLSRIQLTFTVLPCKQTWLLLNKPLMVAECETKINFGHKASFDKIDILRFGR